MISNLMHFDEYNNDTIKHLRSVQLMILEDFIKLCEDNNIQYFAYCGTALGAVRHGGYIPWDDDIDVVMFRKEYDKFINIFEDMNLEKYSLISFDKNEDYFYFMSKISLNGTEFKQSWSRNTDFKLGINIDIFIFEDVPDTFLKRFLYLKKVKLLGSILAVFIVSLNKNYSSIVQMIIAKIGIKFLKLFKITPKKVKNSYLKLIYKNNEKNYSHVFDNSATNYNTPFDKRIFDSFIKISFENLDIVVPNDYDEYLTVLYGDYMTIPPENERLVHEHDYIDFGKY